MTRTVATFLVILGVLGPTAALAQESRPAAGAVEVTVIPGGSTFFQKGKDTREPSFGNYDIGGALAVNFNRFVGVEGEVAGSLGISQGLEFPTVQRDLKSPNMLEYSGNLVLSAANRSSVVPYVTGGIGGLSIFDRTALNIANTKTFLTGNVGGGLKWYAGRWGLRADYRFLAVRSQDDAPQFFGRETRYGHRLYGGVILNIR
jgi:hypothetical protein